MIYASLSVRGHSGNSGLENHIGAAYSAASLAQRCSLMTSGLITNIPAVVQSREHFLGRLEISSGVAALNSMSNKQVARSGFRLLRCPRILFALVYLLDGKNGAW